MKCWEEPQIRDGRFKNHCRRSPCIFSTGLLWHQGTSTKTSNWKQWKQRVKKTNPPQSLANNPNARARCSVLTHPCSRRHAEWIAKSEIHAQCNQGNDQIRDPTLHVEIRAMIRSDTHPLLARKPLSPAKLAYPHQYLAVRPSWQVRTVRTSLPCHSPCSSLFLLIIRNIYSEN